MIRLTNTLSGEKEPFQPAGDPVLMYVCGVTPYARSHLGHAMCGDPLRRHPPLPGATAATEVQLRPELHRRRRQDHCNRAQAEGIGPSELAEQALAERYFREFLDETAALGILPADGLPARDRVDRADPGDHRGRPDPARAAASPTPPAATSTTASRASARATARSLNRHPSRGCGPGARVEVGEHKEAPARLRRSGRAPKPGRARLAQPVGAGAPGLAHRVLGDEPGATSARPDRHPRRRTPT
ncbi:MAG: hypothetical protein KatS3mg061_1852 [Dehalococcoidia bacterium]|nr:MAG: hypothetical protein KatS3mg061_1852 [Dehalococcoidia bacterium]